MESPNSQLFKLLDYPRKDAEKGKELYEKLKKAGISELKFAAKGYRGVVFKGKLKGKEVAVKVKRSDSRKESLAEKEFSLLKYLYDLYKSQTPAPKPLLAGKDFIVMEWIEGKPFLEAFKEKPKETVKQAIKACYLLDRAGIEHSEIKGGKHLITTKKGIKVIDFESAKLKERPRNLLQFVGYYLIGKGLYKELGTDPKELRELLEAYKKEPEKAYIRLENLF
ncbi:RIO1 family regulatory kinase/ATPase domain-containing protein [Thermovibrio sp.]